MDMAYFGCSKPISVPQTTPPSKQTSEPPTPSQCIKQEDPTNEYPVGHCVGDENESNSSCCISGQTSGENKREKSLSDAHVSGAFGAVGVPMLVTLVVCISWTNCLICVTLLPNQVANWLMGTEGYDHGSCNDQIGAAGLAFVNACYLYVIVKMLRWRKTVLHLQQATLRPEEQRRVDSATDSWMCTASARFKTQYVELTSFRGSKRKFWNVCLKIFNLTMQVTVLLELLEIGNPVALVYGYTAFISVGSLAGAIKILIGKFSAMGEVIAGCVFDLFAAIVFPVLVLVYCYYNFQFDDAVFATYLEILPIGSFERSAAVFADPSEMALFRLHLILFESNLGSIFWYQPLVLLSSQAHWRCPCWAHLRRAQSVQAHRTRRPRRQRPVPRVFAVFFIAFSVVVWMVANQAITDSHARCSHYPQCVVFAYRWKHGGMCPCKMLIDVDRAPKTYEEWFHPVDVYRRPSIGNFWRIELINRQLLELPDELRACRHLSSCELAAGRIDVNRADCGDRELIYTGIQNIPPWAKEFKYLQTLHLEGKVGSQNLLSLPDDLFSECRGYPLFTLEFIQNWRVFRLSVVFRISSVHGAFTGSLDFTLSRPIQLCCNGFRGVCDLTDNYCAKNPTSSIAAASCFIGEPFLGNAGTREAFNRFNASICQKMTSDLLIVPDAPTKQTIEMCNSKPFARCERPVGGLASVTTLACRCCHATEMTTTLGYVNIRFKRCGAKITKYTILKQISAELMLKATNPNPLLVRSMTFEVPIKKKLAPC
ncbi:hypothetical protein GQ600_3970 [Phytophthora cactorum]|nr:hypothetical protein GQ600_3970 [Phytophthora cactorum]